MDQHHHHQIKLSDLIQRSQPLSATSALSSNRPITKSPNYPSPTPTPTPTPPQNHPLLKTLNHPTTLIGTLTLPPFPPPNNNTSINCNCFRFFDDSGSVVCCDVLNFCPNIIDKRIKINAWNFIPGKIGSCNGFLEIIDFVLVELNGDGGSGLSNVDLFSMSSSEVIDGDGEDSLKGKYFVYGALESVSPVTVVPCAVRSRGSDRSSDSKSVCGFLVKMLICECGTCKGKDLEIVLRDLDERKESGSTSSCHRFDKPMIVYFCGSASAWHAVITRMIGKVLVVSGLKKKLVYIGKDESQLMYVTTENGVLYLPRVPKNVVGRGKIDVRGSGECGCYRGTVTGSYMRGMVIELDREVMLLLTEKQFRVPHSLRVGAIVSIKNVHFVNPRFPWSRVLILGACFRTSITVEVFSPLETGCYAISHSQSLIEKFVHSLCFCSRLWMLLLLTTLRRKFSGFLSEKEILGTRNRLIWRVARCCQREGLAQKFASSHLPLSAFRCQNGVFMDFCKHDSCRCGGNTLCGRLKLVVPISNLFSHCKVILKQNFLEKETEYEALDTKKIHHSLSCGGIIYGLLAKKIIHADHIGVLLLGYLKISSSSGRLQLVDATGEIDVALSNLPSNWHCNKLIEIKDFNITMEIPNDNWNRKPLRDELFTCQSVFSTSPPMKEMNMTTYLTCTYNNVEVVNPGSTSAVKCIGNFHVFDGGTFHLLWLLHKIPIINVFQGEQVDSNKMSVFAEAVVLPWVLLSEKDSDAHLHVHSCDQLKNTHAYVVPADIKIGRNENSESVTLKKCNIHKLMRKHANADSVDAKGGDFSSGFLPTYSCSRGIQNSFESRCPFQIPCKITGKSVTKNYTGLLKRRDFKEKTRGSCSMLARTVLLEFNQESLSEYQALKVHNYYMLKDCQQDLSSFKEGIKLHISTGMHFWSCSISCPEILQESNSVSSIQSCHSNVKKNEELNKFDTCSDINISIPCSKNYCKFDSEVSSSIGRPSLLLEGGIEKHNCKRARISTSCPSSEISYHDQVLPEGHLMSLHGLVISVHDTSESHFPAQAAHPGARPHPVLLQGKSSICIHVVTDNRNVKISGRFSRGAFPAGIERGVRATFHRILELNGRNDYMLIPASFVEIDSSSPLKNKFGDGNGYTSPEAAPFVPNSEVLLTENQPLQLHCRVLAVYVLVLEKTRKSTSCDPESFVDIILAGFVLDSGTSSYCCWANHETAAALLKLRVEKCEFKSCHANAPKQSRKKEACGSTIHQLHKILQKYGRIVVKNEGPVHDSICHDLTISVSSEKIISHSDENILRRLILNSCFSTVQTVIGNIMDDSSTKQLEKYVAECRMNIPPLQNIWATGVHQMDPLSEARNIYHGLVGTN